MLGRHALTHAGFLGRRAAAAEGDEGGTPARGTCPGDRGVPRARREARHARGRPVVRRPEAGRGGTGPVHRAAAAAPRRAGGRHERRGDRTDGAGRARDPRRARHLHRPGRARHGHGDEHRRPGHGPRLRSPHRRRDARGDPGRPRGDPRLPRIRGRHRPLRPPRTRTTTRRAHHDAVPVAVAQRSVARRDLRAHRPGLRHHLQGQRGHQLHAGLARAPRGLPHGPLPRDARLLGSGRGRRRRLGPRGDGGRARAHQPAARRAGHQPGDPDHRRRPHHRHRADPAHRLRHPQPRSPVGRRRDLGRRCRHHHQPGPRHRRGRRCSSGRSS